MRGWQGQLEELVQQWKGVLDTLKRPWGEEDIAAALVEEGEEAPQWTPLEDLLDADLQRLLFGQITGKVVAAYAAASEYKQVQRSRIC